MKSIIMNPIGKIHSPYKTIESIPRQDSFKEDVEAYVELKDEFIKGLKDLDGFSHAFLLFYFHKSEKENLQGKPYFENKTHGIFAIRSPHRPNHIGLSVIKIKKIERNRIYFTEVDMIDGTPVIDIKPYVKHYDCKENAISGWIDKHFKNRKILDNAIVKDKN